MSDTPHSTTTYFELLRDPRWQRKRLEILKLNNFSCEECGAVDKTLHVHHGYYERGLAPWDYPDDSLHSLCEDCHEKAETLRRAVIREFGTLPLVMVPQVLGYIRGLQIYQFPQTKSSMRDVGFEGIVGVSDAWGVNTMAIIQSLCDNPAPLDGYRLDSMKRDVCE